MVGAFVTAFEAGIRLAALVLVVAIAGAAIVRRIIEGELSGSHAAIGLLFVAGLLIGVVSCGTVPLSLRFSYSQRAWLLCGQWLKWCRSGNS